MYHTFDNILSISFGLMLGYFLCFIIFGYFIYKRLSKIEDPVKRSIYKAAPVIFLFLMWIIGFGLAEILEYKSRIEVREFLNEDSGSYKVIVNGAEVDNPAQIVGELKKLNNIYPHSSHPVNEIEILVIRRNKRTLKLRLGRDSSRKNEYWVYYPVFKHTSMNEIGRITSAVFDNIK